MKPIILLVLVLFTVAACAETPPSSTAGAKQTGVEEHQAAGRAEAVTEEEFASEQLALADAGDWGTIRGQLVFTGQPIPPRKPLTVNKDQEHCLSKGPIPADDWVVNPDNKGVRWVLAALRPPRGKEIEIHPSLLAVDPPEVVLDQPFCRYIPHVFGVREGQKLVAKNPDPVSHNVSISGFRNQANPIIPAGGSHTFDLRMERTAVKVACGIHPWMAGYFWMFDHPYFAVTDEDGRFEIKLAPSGDLHLMLWHDQVGYVVEGGKQGMPVTVKAGEITDLGQIEIKPKD